MGDAVLNFGIGTGIAIFLAIAATVLAFIFIVPQKKREKLNKFGKFLHDTVNFKYLIVEKILQALYIFFTAFVILLGFFMLFYVERSNWLGGNGIALMIIGPVVIRLIYELLFMLILLVKNVISINNKLKNQCEDGVAEDIFAVPDVSQFKKNNSDESAEAQSQVIYCPNCGNPCEDGLFCTKCGTRLQ